LERLAAIGAHEGDVVRAFLRWCGVALSAAAFLTVGLNVVLTPMLPDGDFSDIASSNAFLWRQSLAAAAALLLLFGIVGLHVNRLSRIGVFGGVSFALALVGGAALFAIEWNQLFTIRDFAIQAPDTLNAVEDAEGLTPFDVGALAAASAFFLGWFLFAVSLLLSGRYSRVSTALVLVGFVIAPLLGAAGVTAAWAAAGASVVIGAGWLLLGLQLMRASSD
jgi:hypothetical protein